MFLTHYLGGLIEAYCRPIYFMPNIAMLDLWSVEGCISETVQNMASDTVMTNRKSYRRIQWYHFELSRVTPNKGSWPKLEKPFIFLKWSWEGQI